MTTTPVTFPAMLEQVAAATGTDAEHITAILDAVDAAGFHVVSTTDLEDTGKTDPESDAQLEQLAAFLASSYPTEARTDETPVATAVRLLDRSRAVPAGGVDPASGQPLPPPAGTPAPPAIATTPVTLTAADVAAGATLTDIAEALDVDAAQLLALNAEILDAEAVARGVGHSDNGRILFAGTTLAVPIPPADS